MKTEEILKLHELSEEEQVEWLRKKDVLNSYVGHGRHGDYEDYESLADCAFRLRDDVVHLGFSWFSLLTDTLRLIFPGLSFGGATMMAEIAKPIIWIQTALLAAPPQKGEG
jgi:hypothetical protein